LERNDNDAAQPPESIVEAPVERNGRREATAPPLNLMSGAAGAVVAIAVSGLLVVGLWAIARNAPSAATDPRLVPPPTAVASPARGDDQLYMTIVQTESGAPAVVTREAGAP
jgi:hypothetical protein